ncbi:MAG: iron-containing alcohol dehydrogenase, partial [Caldilineae bacterium]
FSNSFVGLAHALGHSLGGHFRIPHGRAVGLFLPYVMEFTANGGAGRYGDLARHLRLHDGGDEAAATAVLVSAIRDLARKVGQPLSLAEAGISAEDFEASLPIIVPNAMMDNAVLAAPRPAEMEEYEKLYRYAFEGKNVDF